MSRGSGFIGVLVGEEDLDAGEIAVEPIEKTVEFGFNRGGELCVHDDIFVAINQNLHGSISWIC